MPDEFFDTHGPRVLWSGHCAVAEYAFDEPNSLPRWTLPEETEVIVTDDRVIYRDVATGASGELHFPWPQHLRVQPGNRATGRAATVTQIQLVCAGPSGTFPALVFAGGDLATVGDADRMANLLRQAIARYRVEHAADLGVPADQVRMLSRMVIGPEFSNYQGGEGQTVTLLGSVAVDWPVGQAPEPLLEEPFLDQYIPEEQYVREEQYVPEEQYVREEQYVPGPAAAGGWPVTGAGPAEAYPAEAYPAADAQIDAEPPPVRPGFTPAAARLPETEWYDVPETPQPDPEWYGIDLASIPEPPQALHQETEWSGFDPAGRPRPADEAALRGTPDLDARAADLAARVAGLVSGDSVLGRLETETTNLSAYLNAPAAHQPRRAPVPAPDAEPTEDRAEQIRRTAARFASNSGRGRTATAARDSDDEPGLPSRRGWRSS
jgi:hypothetical protein